MTNATKARLAVCVVPFACAAAADPGNALRTFGVMSAIAAGLLALTWMPFP